MPRMAAANGSRKCADLMEELLQRATGGPQWAPFGEFSGIADERLDLPFPGKSKLSLP
jgi:hypothetical protein